MESAKSAKNDSKSGRSARDPFAVDIFGTDLAATGASSAVFSAVSSSPLPAGVTRNWADGLANVSLDESSPVPSLPDYPQWLDLLVTDVIVPKLTSFIASERYAGHFEILSYEPADVSDRIVPGIERRDVLVNFEALGEKGKIIFSSEFATELIDLILGTTANRDSTPRSLSEIEIAICEFIVAAAFSALNTSVGNGVRIRLTGVSNSNGAEQTDVAEVAEVVGDLVIGNASAMVSAHLPYKLLRGFKAILGARGGKAPKNTLAKRFGEHVAEVPLSLVVGTTTIAAVEIPFLEKGDVILVEKPAAPWWSAETPNSRDMICLIGGAANCSLLGSYSEAEGYKVSSITMSPRKRGLQRMKNEEFAFGEQSANEENNMSERSPESKTVQDNVSTEERNDGGLVSLENVMVDLRVQIAGKKISLDELAKIRTGQIIDLGSRPDDPVELFAENSDRPIAAGELVKIDDRLGVRIVKMFV